ncbi:NmrA/HSCARG family protein [Amycolatopsis pithecellobii]|uniref:NAD(P)H-binding protein n=1 Tax=Amycolatopsis pithecellobii TaxID=664692 RepID=A0A6N7ZAX6_9PSEU|nr:NmrA/HSCARG family protein [Amycolatopsis pithecellobii]MTD58914.1 NAD(P)H-binding protein [Amycolatopsis pithecellobii]
MTSVLVIGGTGAMGSAVVRNLVATTDKAVTVLTRDPSSARAQALRSSGAGRVTLQQGDIDDQSSLAAAMKDVDEVFCNTDFFSTLSPRAEYEQGVRLLHAAEQAGVGKFVWSSLDYAATLTDGKITVPHYDGKAAVESYIGLRRSEEMMAKRTDGWYSKNVAVLVTAPYFENFQYRLAPLREQLPDGRDGVVFAIPLGDGKYPLIGLDDIGWFASHLLDQWERWQGGTLRVVSESLTGQEIAAAFERATGIPSVYRPVPLDDLRAAMPDIGHDMAAMFEFFQEYDVFTKARDIAALRTIHPGLESFENWTRRTGWQGDTLEVQKRPVQVTGRS